MDQLAQNMTVSSDSEKKSPPSRDELLAHQIQILNEGQFANAIVRLCRVGDTEWVMKDYGTRRRWVQTTVGRMTLGREFWAINALAGLRGIPQDIFRVDATAIAFRFIPGRTIAKSGPEDIPEGYFPALEKLVQDMHERGVAHLDLRYMHNVIVGADGLPYLIDFQTALPLRRCPDWLSRIFRQVDISGVYKHWCKKSPQTMDEGRRQALEKQNRLRRFWILRGYFWMHLGKKKKKAVKATS